MIYRIKYIHPNGVVMNEEVTDKPSLQLGDIWENGTQKFELTIVGRSKLPENGVQEMQYGFSLINDGRVCLSFVSIKTGAPVKLIEVDKFRPEEVFAGKTMHDSEGVAYTILGYSKVSDPSMTEYRIFVEEQ